jgi:hypothetical protein
VKDGAAKILPTDIADPPTGMLRFNYQIGTRAGLAQTVARLGLPNQLIGESAARHGLFSCVFAGRATPTLDGCLARAGRISGASISFGLIHFIRIHSDFRVCP